jgi:transposase
MSKGSGLSRSERRRNARKERLRALVPRGGAMVGMDLGEDMQALAVIDHDVQVQDDLVLFFEGSKREVVVGRP